MSPCGTDNCRPKIGQDSLVDPSLWTQALKKMVSLKICGPIPRNGTRKLKAWARGPDPSPGTNSARSSEGGNLMEAFRAGEGAELRSESGGVSTGSTGTRSRPLGTCLVPGVFFLASIAAEPASGPSKRDPCPGSCRPPRPTTLSTGEGARRSKKTVG